MSESPTGGAQVDRAYKKKRVEEIGSTLAQIRAAHKRSTRTRKDDDTTNNSTKANQQVDGQTPEKNELYMLFEQDRAKAVKLVRERPKMKEALENLKLDREQQKMVEKKIEETRAKQAAPLPEISPEVQKRIYDMELTIHNLKESLGEKDKVLCSKTESLKMLNDQLSQRSTEFMERAELMRNEIASLKDEYSHQEENIKAELNRYKNKLHSTEIKLGEKEAECKGLASLQEEIVQLRSAHSECDNRLAEAKHSMDTLNKFTIKLKAQLKSTRVDRDNLKQELANFEGVSTLQERIALLEEEKELASSTQKRVEELETALKSNRDLLEEVQTEKESFRQNVELTNAKLSEQDELIRRLKDSLAELEQSKICSEMKCVELEEKMDADQTTGEENRAKADKLEKEIGNLRLTLVEQEDLIKSLHERLQLKEQEVKLAETQPLDNAQIDGIASELREWQEKCVETEEKLRRIEEHNRELTDQLSELKGELMEQQTLVTNHSRKEEDLLATIASCNHRIATLESEMSNTKKEDNSNKKVAGQDQTALLKKLAAKLKLTNKACQELEASSKEKDSLLEGLNGEKIELTAQLEEARRAQQRLEENLTSTSQDLEALEIKYNEVVNRGSYESEIESLREHIGRLERELKNCVETINEKEITVNQAQMEIEALLSQLKISEKELERIQDMYEGESVKNEGILNNIGHLESELSISRDEMIQLAEQLREVSYNYEKSQGELETKDNYIEELERDVEEMRRKVGTLEKGIEERQKIMREKTENLGFRLQEAEQVSMKFEKYQRETEEMINSYKEMERSLLGNIDQLNIQINDLKNVSSELAEKNNELTGRVSEMETELGTLKDIRNAYENTLDQIEILNEDLKQVMSQFESKNEELIKIGEERRILVEKVGELEESCVELQSQLRDAESQVESVKVESEKKGHHLDQANQEIASLQAQICSLQAFENSNHQQNLEINNLRVYYEDLIHNLNREKEDIMRMLKREVASEVEEVVEKATRRVGVEGRGAVGGEAKDEEDGWGWIGQDQASLDEANQNSALQDLSNRVRQLELDNTRLADELKASQIKCGKLMKKVKEVMLKNEQLEKNKSRGSVGFEDLDFALQEEMRSQIDKLEQKKKEMGSELGLLKAEKERLIKKIDVLESANEQLVEMKERQDIEVQMWQKRSNELKNQVQALEWNLEELKGGDLVNQDNEEKLTALVSENEELQKIICELKDNKPLDDKHLLEELEKLREQVKTSKESDDGLKNNDYKELSERFEAATKQCDELLAVNSQLNAQRNELQTMLTSTVEQLSGLQQEHTQLSARLQEREASLANAERDKNTAEENSNLLAGENNIIKEDLDRTGKMLEEANKKNGEMLETLQKIKQLQEIMSNENMQLQLELDEVREEASKRVEVKEETVEKQTNVMVETSAPPVFRGFASVGEDPFQSLAKQGDREDEISELRKERDELAAKLEGAEVRTNQEILSRKEKEQEFAKLGEKLEEAYKETRAWKEQVAKLQAELERLVSEMQTAGSEGALKKNKLMELQAGLDQATREAQEATAQSEALTVQLQNMGSVQEVRAQQILQLQAKLEETSQENVVLMEKIATLNNQLEQQKSELKTRLEEASKELENVEALRHHQVEELQTKLNQALAEAQNGNVRVANLERVELEENSKVSELQARLDEALGQVGELQSALDSSQIREDQRSELQSELDKVREENATLEGKLEDAVSKLDYTSQAFSQKESALEYYSNRVQELEGYLEQAQQIQEAYLNLQQKLTSQEEYIEELRKEIETLLSEKVQLQRDLSERNNLNEQYTHHIQALNHQLESQKTPTVSEGKPNQVMEMDMLLTMVAEKDAEIERVSDLLTQTQERLIREVESRFPDMDKKVQLQKRLDDALYTLHERDVRCEELTLEIMQLLEERDTLQLRLSDSLRMNERLQTDSPVPIVTPVQPSATIHHSASITDKIDELHSSYRRDPTVQIERENRHSQQMHLYSENNEAPNDELNNTGDYGLFNWFFGTTSPSPPSPKPTRTT